LAATRKVAKYSALEDQYIFQPISVFLGTYNGKPMGNTYSHNCMMHRDTMLKFGTLFYLAKYFQ